jgi:hypothetical protein
MATTTDKNINVNLNLIDKMSSGMATVGAKTKATLSEIKANFTNFYFMAQAGWAGVQRAMEMANVAAQYDEMRNAASGMAEAHGTSIDQMIDDVQRAAQGTVSKMYSVQAASRGMIAGFKPDMIIKFMETAENVSDATGISVQETYEAMIQGSANLQERMLRGVKIYVDSDLAFKEYAKSVGKTVGQLTPLEKKQAMANAVLQKGGEIAKSAGNNFDSAADQIERYKAAVEDFHIFIGRLVQSVGLLIKAAIEGVGLLITESIALRAGVLKKELEVVQWVTDKIYAALGGNKKAPRIDTRGLDQFIRDMKNYGRETFKAGETFRAALNAPFTPKVSGGAGMPEDDTNAPGAPNEEAEAERKNLLQQFEKLDAERRLAGMNEIERIRAQAAAEIAERQKVGANTVGVQEFYDAQIVALQKKRQADIEALIVNSGDDEIAKLQLQKKNELEVWKDSEEAKLAITKKYDKMIHDTSIKIAKDEAAKKQAIWEENHAMQIELMRSSGQGLVSSMNYVAEQMINGQKVSGEMLAALFLQQVGSTVQGLGTELFMRGLMTVWTGKSMNAVVPGSGMAAELTGGQAMGIGAGMMALGAAMGAMGGKMASNASGGGGGAGGGGGGGSQSTRPNEFNQARQGGGKHKQVHIHFENVYGNVDEAWMKKNIKQVKRRQKNLDE